MSLALFPAAPTRERPTLSLFAPPDLEPESLSLRIDGCPARIVLWTAAEYRRIPPALRPPDARLLRGNYVALRLDD